MAFVIVQAWYYYIWFWSDYVSGLSTTILMELCHEWSEIEFFILLIVL